MNITRNYRIEVNRAHIIKGGGNCWENLQPLHSFSTRTASRQAPRPPGAKDPTIFQTLFSIKFFSPPHSPSFSSHTPCLSPSEIRRPISRSHRKFPCSIFFPLPKSKKNLLTCKGPRKTHRPTMLLFPLTLNSLVSPASRRVSPLFSLHVLYLSWTSF